MFLRLAGCNLTCGGTNTIKSKKIENGATWRCDTIEVWTKGSHQSFDEIVMQWETYGWIEKLIKGSHLVITGGEPLLQQHSLIEFFYFFKKKYKFLPIIEIETNATILPLKDFSDIVHYFNVSPKLANSGIEIKKRVCKDSLKYFSQIDYAIFKFVVSSEQDVYESIDTFIKPFHLQPSTVYLMPAADNKKKLKEIQEDIIQLSIQYSFCYSHRLHIDIWDQKTGV